MNQRVGPAGRSFLPIDRADLARLAEIATRDRTAFFRAHPDWAKLYETRVVCVALCQGAAQHYLDGSTGIQDFDVYTFYAEHPGRRWCYRRIKQVDFGDPEFGQSPDAPRFVGRRVDLLGRDLPCALDVDPVKAVQTYLVQGRTGTARYLASKAVIMPQGPTQRTWRNRV